MAKFERISEEDIPEEIARIERIEQLAKWLDDAYRIPGTNFRVGWDTIIGLVPGIGDAATTLMSAWMINEARRLGVSRWTLLRMVSNVGIDAIVGIVPFVGDLFDVAFKSNRKNMNLLRKSLAKRPSRQVQPNGVEVEVLKPASRSKVSM
ncbi:hypothetical protein Pla110_41630 [Polystyrenella longa]|uniref:DUF4112 domain-containing protein n=1 Tax=Polystyrenella longa TaxID=2528007 RepID=A0A518CT52_9PLAN|nr:DUF4112 domain-containing protein [Polystyrenella longa]QDU82408.1 hypothetical protein Pla110_41630 [Polystyrenella longa]